MTYLRNELRRAERALAVAEEQEAAVALRRAIPDPPAWVIERGIGAGRPPVSIHAGDCWDQGKRCRPVSAEEARRALSGGVPACTHCRPDTALGVID